MHYTFTVMPTALIWCAKAVPVASKFFALTQTLYNFMSTPKAHKEFHPDKQLHQLQQLSDIRWACRQSAVHAIFCTFNSILATLVKEIENGNDQANAMEDRELLQIRCFNIVLSLVVFDRLLSCSKGLSDVLQRTQIDLGKAAVLVTAETLEDFRSDETWRKVLNMLCVTSL